MALNNGSMTYNRKYVSFINKGVMLLLYGLLLLVIIPCSYLMFAYWFEMPILIQILGPILLAFVLAGIAMSPLNGIIITRKGTLLFIPDFRVKKTHVEELERISLNFNEWENLKYSATVKLTYKDGSMFTKNYAKRFRNMKNKSLSMAMYTISKRRVDKICEALSDAENCIITVVDQNHKITYQNR
jgi:hypothetical protein